MPAKYESRIQGRSSRVWVGKYRILHNLPHWHLAFELVCCANGQVRLMLGGRILTLEAGEAAIIPGSYVHYINTELEGIVHVAQIDASLMEAAVGQYRLKNMKFRDKYRISQGLEEIYGELSEKPLFYMSRAETVITRLLIDILRGEYAEPAAIDTGSSSILRYKDLLGEINRRYEFITFQEAAEFMHMSEAYFSRFFKKFSGMTFSNYLNLIKVDNAVEKLRQDPDYPTTKLMMECGFNTLRHFHRVFKDFTGYSPGRLPEGFSLNMRYIFDNSSDFDPTLPDSVEIV